MQKPGYKQSMQANKRQLPAKSVGVESINTPSGINITYKNPGAEGIYETTLAGQSYAGLVSLVPKVHSFVNAV